MASTRHRPMFAYKSLPRHNTKNKTTKEAEQRPTSSKWDPSIYLNVLNKNDEILQYESPFPHPEPKYFPYLHDDTLRELKQEGDEHAETWIQFESDDEDEIDTEDQKSEQDTDEDEEENYRVRVYREYKRRRMLCKQQIANKNARAERVKAGDSIICMAGDGMVSGALGTGYDPKTSVKNHCATFPIPLRPLYGRKIKMIAAGIMSTAVVTENNEIYAWGSNDKSGLSINPENADEVDVSDDDDQLSEDEAWDRIYSHYVSLLSDLYRKYQPQKLKQNGFVENLVLKQKHETVVIKYRNRQKEFPATLCPLTELEELIDEYAARYQLNRNLVSYRMVIDIAKSASNMHNNLYLRECQKYNVAESEKQSLFIPIATKEQRRDRKLNPYKYLLSASGKREDPAGDSDDENLFPYVETDEDGVEDEYQATIACSYWTPARIRLPLRNVIVKQVTLGGSHMVVLDALGRVFSCGTFCSDGVVGHHWDFETSRIIRYQRELKQLKYMQSANDDRITHRRGDYSELPAMESIASGTNHFLMLDKNGCIRTVGVSKLGQKTSTRNQRKYLSPQIVSIASKKTKNGTIRKSEIEFKKIACGNYHNLAIDTCCNLYSWGQNSWGQCGHEARYNGHGDAIDQPRFVEFYEPKKDTNDEDEENVAVQDYRIEDVVAGEHMTVALDANGNVWTCGRNACQQLGRKTRVSLKSKPDLMRMVTDLKHIVVDWIGCGSLVWFAHNKNNGSVYAYGDSITGRAGVGKWKCARGRPVFDEHNFDLDKYEVVAADGGFDHVCFHVRKKRRLRRRNCETPMSSKNDIQCAKVASAFSGLSLSHRQKRSKRLGERGKMPMTAVKEKTQESHVSNSKCESVAFQPVITLQEENVNSGLEED